MKTRLAVLAQPHRTGIGNQVYDLCRYLSPTKVLCYDMSNEWRQDEKKVSRTNWFDQWDTRYTNGVPQQVDINWLCDGVDIVYVVENPLNYKIFSTARERGVKSVMTLNAEYLDYTTSPNLPKPDLFLAPSKWRWAEVNQVLAGDLVKYLPVPVATDRFTPLARTHATTFLHIAGHLPSAERNGTATVLEAWRLKRNPDAKLIVRAQAQGIDFSRWQGLPNLMIEQTDTPDYWDLYEGADVLLLPRKWGGLSLQLQEAAATGIPAIVGRHDPYAHKPSPQVDSIPGSVKMMRGNRIPTFEVLPRELAFAIDMVASNEPSMAAASQAALDFARSISWDTMKAHYQQTLEKLVNEGN